MSKDSSAKYCQNDKERLPKKSSWKIAKSSLKKKRKKRQYGCERYPWENEKQKLVEYKKNIIKWEKTPYCNCKKLLF